MVTPGHANRLSGGRARRAAAWVGFGASAVGMVGGLLRLVGGHDAGSLGLTRTSLGAGEKVQGPPK